ncbi:MAG: S-layer homology domain-containing protein [Oscillospiraceae bacterium]|nr:S-layer homology domain-containing protein [Oscillospiraceae bacterium]
MKKRILEPVFITRFLSLSVTLCLCLNSWLCAQASGFTDVPEDQYCYVPVQWAVERGITAGTSPTTFAPGDTCTKGQVLTFLWRAVGSPEPDLPEINPFPLASEDAYYYKALHWALSAGALYDTLDFDFDQVDPDAPCTRLTAIFYMWSVLGYLPENLEHPFTDIAFSIYTPAVAWALEACVTEGTAPTVFSPDDICTRGQVVTFLFRALYLTE